LIARDAQRSARVGGGSSGFTPDEGGGASRHRDKVEELTTICRQVFALPLERHPVVVSEADMDDRDESIEQRDPSVLAKPQVTASRVGTYAVLGAVAGGIPLPWLPRTASLRIRGALVHDIAARHHVSLTPEARKALADPSGEKGRSIPRVLAGFATGQILARLGPLALFPIVSSALGTFVLGHLFERYLGSRPERSVRLDVLEARRVRTLIDEAMMHAITGDVPAPPEHTQAAPEEMRETATQLVDGFIIAAAGVPGYFVRKLEAAFDDLLLNRRGGWG
jgi:hypothetical protein